MRYYFYIPEDYNMIMSHHVVFLKKEFIQNEGSGRKIELEEKFLKSMESENLNPVTNQ